MKNELPGWLYTRPRILNVLHSLGMANPYSQMNAIEKACLQKHAQGKKLGLEIGTFMGVTATIIASSMVDDGKLYCVDPFELRNGQLNPGYKMAVRCLKRKNVLNKVKFLLGYSTDQNIINQIPEQLDFILVDGDHSYEGLTNDWKIVSSKLAPGGIVCLHDTTIPADAPDLNFGSVQYFNDVIINDQHFSHIETVYSMNVLVKK